MSILLLALNKSRSYFEIYILIVFVICSLGVHGFLAAHQKCATVEALEM